MHKTILTFLAGALLATGVVYLALSPRSAAPSAETAKIEAPAAAPTTDSTDSAPIATPEATESAPATTAPLASDKPSPTRGWKPAASSKAHASPSKGSSTPATTPAASSSPTAGSTSSNSGQSQQQQTSNNAPVTPPYYDPAKNMPSGPPPEPPKRTPKTVTIPAGTSLTVRIDQPLNSERSKSGDTFAASLDQPLIIDGAVIAERGAKVEGKVVQSDPGGRVSGLAQLQLQLVRLNTSDGQRVNIMTESFSKQAQSEKKKDAAKVGAAAGIGAAIGAIAGGGKGAGLGAIIGGAAGTGGVMATRGAAAQIPAETRLTFHLRDAITLTEKID